MELYDSSKVDREYDTSLFEVNSDHENDNVE